MNHDDPKFDPRLELGPEHIWNLLGMIQQAVMFALLAVVYGIVTYILARTSTIHPGLEQWISGLNGLFITETLGADLLWGALLGIGLAVILSGIDTLIGLISRTDTGEWMHRNDYLLPVTSKQKKWAFCISMVGSIQEEIFFRGFILIAILPLWSHWIWAALILSAVFSFLHAGVQGFWSTLWIFTISIAFCAVIALGGSIYFVAVAHMFVNLTNLFLLPVIFKKHDE